MDKSYRYSIFIVVGKTDFKEISSILGAQNGCEIFDVNTKDDHTKFEFTINVGLNREDLESILDELEKIDEKVENIEIFDPNLHQKLNILDDGTKMVESILKHDQWILNNIGGDPQKVYNEKYELLSPKTKLILWFSGVLILLYFLTQLSLSYYFS